MTVRFTYRENVIRILVGFGKEGDVLKEKIKYTNEPLGKLRLY